MPGRRCGHRARTHWARPHRCQRIHAPRDADATRSPLDDDAPVSASGVRPPGRTAPLDTPAYRATALRHPAQPLVILPQTLTELTGPVFGDGTSAPLDHDLTHQHAGDAAGATHRRRRPRARRRRPCGAAHARRGVAGERRGPLSRTRSTSGTRRSTPTSRAPAARSPTPTDATASSPSGRARIHGGTTTTRGGPRTSTSRCSARRSSRGWSRRCTSPAIRCWRSIRSSTPCPMPLPAQRMIAMLRLDAHRAGVRARLPLRSRAARPRPDADGGAEVDELHAVPDRGPYLHSGFLTRSARMTRLAADHRSS